MQIFNVAQWSISSQSKGHSTSLTIVGSPYQTFHLLRYSLMEQHVLDTNEGKQMS